MKIDSHQHFWNYIPAAYKWIHHPALMHDFLPDQLMPLLESCQFDGTVAVQARSSLEETAWLLKLAEKYTFIKGVVGWADLCDPDLASHLEVSAASRRFCGIRTSLRVDSDEPEHFEPDFLKGMVILGEFNVAFDILIRPAQLPMAYLLVDTFPEQVFVLDHIANPAIEDHIMEPWVSDMRKLATLPNVYCKLSGMVTRASHTSWQKSDFGPYLDVVFDAFGAERLMIGSDWPVCTQAASYQQTIDIVLDAIADFTLDERRAILGETANHAYGLHIEA